MANVVTRKKMVLAMEFIARCVNDEDVFEPWLTIGVADGDISRESLDTAEVDDYYVDDDNFRDLMDGFLRMMALAKEYGGLYCDGIMTREG